MTQLETGNFAYSDRPTEVTPPDVFDLDDYDTDVDGITATGPDLPELADIPDDLPDDYPEETPLAYDVDGAPIDFVELAQQSMPAENPYEGLDDWAATFDEGTLPTPLDYDGFRHFHVGLDVDSGHESPQAAWGSALAKGYAATEVTFEGNRDHAATCMAAFERGVRFVFERFAEKGVELELPPVRVVSDPAIASETVSMAASASEILVNGAHLEEISELPEHEALQPIDDSGYVLSCTPAEIYTIIGVEEAHHNIHERLMPPVDAPRPSRNATLDVYHADEREFQALRWKIMAAKAFGMSDDVVRPLERNYQASKLLRRQAREAAKDAAGGGQ